MSNRAGVFKNNLSGISEYKSFSPTLLPVDINIDDDMIKLLVQANKLLGILDSMSTKIPNINLFIYMYIRKEAILSSQIEGTQCTLEDLFNSNTKKTDDIIDVVNYVKATEFALSKLKELPICNRFLRDVHAVLLSGVRGKEKNPGEFRKSQNWIGGEGSTIKNATYVPPNIDDMDLAMSNLEQFINQDDDIDKLIKISLIHYQFETIHPFLDGNGRIGRLLITLYLIENGILHVPAIYISYYLKRNRIEYYDRMSEVRRNGNYEQWIKFFLRAFIESSNDAIETIQEMTNLHNDNIQLVHSDKKLGEKLAKTINYLESNPIIDITKLSKDMSISFNTASKYIDKLIDLKILSAVGDNARNRIFEYTKYLEILKQGIE